MTEVTAVLRDAVKASLPGGKYKLVGTIYGDTKRRFQDGTRVVTSTVTGVDGDVFKTVNSAYRVQTWEVSTNAVV
jgi:hypothetical protein